MDLVDEQDRAVAPVSLLAGLADRLAQFLDA